MAAAHVVVVAIAVLTLYREPSWLFAVLVGVIALFAVYWIRAASGRDQGMP